MENPDREIDSQIRAIRGFNRFYTRLAGILEDMYLGAPMRLSEARVLYEISVRPGCKAGGLSSRLGMDPGYLSRTIACLEKLDLISREPDPSDRRARTLHLTKDGKAMMDVLNQRSCEKVRSIIKPLDQDQRRRLVQAMQQIQDLLQSKPDWWQKSSQSSDPED